MILINCCLNIYFTLHKEEYGCNIVMQVKAVMREILKLFSFSRNVFSPMQLNFNTNCYYLSVLQRKV